jgi:hypothetical protein
MMVDDAADAYLCEADGSREAQVVHDEKHKHIAQSR